MRGGLPRLAQEYHTRLLWRATALAVVAGPAGRDKVLPDVLAATVLGDDVIQGELSTSLAAVLASIAVAGKDFSAGEAWTRVGAADEV